MLSDQREEKNKNTLLLIRGLAKKCRVDNRTAFAWLLLSLSDRANVRNHIFAQWLYKKITTHGVSYSHWYWTNVLLFLEKLSPVKNVQQVFYTSLDVFLKRLQNWRKNIHILRKIAAIATSFSFQAQVLLNVKRILIGKAKAKRVGLEQEKTVLIKIATRLWNKVRDLLTPLATLCKKPRRVSEFPATVTCMRGEK